jgi:hypothetical protein
MDSQIPIIRPPQLATEIPLPPGPESAAIITRPTVAHPSAEPFEPSNGKQIVSPQTEPGGLSRAELNEMSCQCLGWCINDPGNLIVTTVRISDVSDPPVRTTVYQLWDVLKMKEIWWTNSPSGLFPWLKPTFSPDGGTFAYLRLSEDGKYDGRYQAVIHKASPARVERAAIIDVRVPRLGSTAPLRDIRRSQYFTIDNKGSRVALSFPTNEWQGTDNFARLERWDGLSKDLDVIFSHLGETSLRYNRGSTRLFCLYFPQNSTSSMTFSAYDLSSGDMITQQEFRSEYPRKEGLEFIKVIKGRHRLGSEGDYLIVSFECSDGPVRRLRNIVTGRGRQEPRREFLYIDLENTATWPKAAHGSSTRGYSETTYRSVQMIPGPLFVDVQRRTISAFALPGKAFGRSELEERYRSLPVLGEREYLNAIAVEGQQLIVLSKEGILYSVDLDEEWQWFMDAF